MEKQLVFSGTDFKKTEELYIQACNTLEKFKGENAEMIGGTEEKVCIDAAFLSRHEDVLALHGYKKQWKPKRAFNSGYGGGGYKNGDNEEGRRDYKEKNLAKKKNPLGPKGKPWTCHYCESEYHFIGNCDKRKKEAKIVEDGSEGEAEDGFSKIAVLEEVEKNPEEADIADVSLALICEETEGKGLLDCACISWTVHVYLQLLVKTGFRSLLRAYLKKTRRTLLKRNLPKHLNLEVVKSDHLLNVLLFQLK